jgi:metal-sulfur cluster biosynthetic enzyme
MINDDQIWDAMRGVIDPELGINVVDLGLVYSVEVAAHRVRVVMTMTTPTCPLNAYITETAESTIRQAVPDVETVSIDMVWDPPWSPAMMSATAKQQLGWRR